MPDRLPRRLFVITLIALLLAPLARADEPPPPPPPMDKAAVEDLAEHVRKSVVVVTFSGRDQKRQGLGSGFVISKDGLIATNLHVIGEARPISVHFSDGTSYDVESIHATHRPMDLAIVKIDADEDLTPLPLFDSDKVRQGQEVVVFGNPRGLKHSVVTGVVSGIREIDGKPMLQLAVPIEQGNSGGPVVDSQGRVLGIVTLKSLVTDQLGFAVAVNALKPLLEKPNPVPLSRWLTIGALNERDWQVLFGARWRQRAGRITVEGRGTGFGGRSLCLSKADPPDVPYEIGVWVRMETQDGAAGLVFHSDGDDKHYGFYPSDGSLRLSRFDGPDVFSWQVLREVRSKHYNPGEWNHLKVRVEKDKFRCFVNDEPVIELADRRYTSGRVGLAKFRHTIAEFRGFQTGKSLPAVTPASEEIERILKLVGELPTERPPAGKLVAKLAPGTDHAKTILEQRARDLEAQAERLRQLAGAVHRKQVREELVSVLDADESDVDLLRAALFVARLDNAELDIDGYLAHVDRMAADVKTMLPDEAPPAKRLEALDKYLFEEMGYHGSRTNYYSKSNSYLNETIDDREGLPITLSVLYIALAHRLDLPVEGVGLPGHFIVRYAPKEGDPQLIDVFDRGKRLSEEDAARIVAETAGIEFERDHLAPASKQAIVLRMLVNLLGHARSARDPEDMLRYVNAVVAVAPDDHQQRFFRGVLRFQTGRLDEALDDADWLLEQDAPNVDLDRVREFRQVVETMRRQTAGEG